MMTLVTGRMPSLHPYCEESNKQGILKGGPTRKQRTEIDSYTKNQAELNQRQDDGKRLVRFCESDENEKQHRYETEVSESESQEVVRFGNNTFIINSSDPNSAVRKLFPNSKLKTINPFLNGPCSKNEFRATKPLENNKNLYNGTSSKSCDVDKNIKNQFRKKADGNPVRRKFHKVPAEINSTRAKTNGSATPLIERIKQLTCDNEDSNNLMKNHKNQTKFELKGRNHFISSKPTESYEKQDFHHIQQRVKDIPKETKEGLNLMRYNQNILQTRSQNNPENPLSLKKYSLTEDARRSFLSSLSHAKVSDASDRNSVASSSSVADTDYSLSDIEEALTEEEEEIKEAFSQENKQDELELFVQQDAGRTERLKKRYSSTPKPENVISPLFSNRLYTSTTQLNAGNYNVTKEKPKFGSTIEILQQLQQQIESPYQLEGRRTACSNYSDSSIPISDRLFCDESSDTYEPVIPKHNVHRSCSLDSKNYEEIDNFPPSCPIHKTKSIEHPYLNQNVPGSYFYPASSMRHNGFYPVRNPPLEQSFYTSSPDLYDYHHVLHLNSLSSSYNNHPNNSRSLHPVLQKQYCRYPLNATCPRPAEEGKVLTPPIRMHTYMNVPTNAPCYVSPPPYPKTNHQNLSTHSDVYPYDTPYRLSNIYQNIPIPETNSHVMSLRRLCTERERGVPEGASISHDSPQEDFYFPPTTATMPKPSSLPHHYCANV